VPARAAAPACGIPPSGYARTVQLLGENNLGILLVELREEFRILKATDPYVVNPLPIPNFTLMGKPVPVVTG